MDDYNWYEISLENRSFDYLCHRKTTVKLNKQANKTQLCF